jgi:hypothetical protein
MNAYLWRDKNDPNQFWIGNKAGSKYYGWMPVFVDGFADCFDADTFAAVNALRAGCDPVEIELTLKVL